jgi:hypothetical protein
MVQGLALLAPLCSFGGDNTCTDPDVGNRLYALPFHLLIALAAPGAR